ncbi:MAG: ComEA family DNA-binding protein [Lachnospiraceae bacterium]|nr:ComEA family DNA-binding protein [Lachnospiraceae bacterium]
MALKYKKGRGILLFLLFIITIAATGCSFSPRGEIIDSSSQSEMSANENQAESSSKAEVAETKIWVHVCGEVKNPGVYSFLPGSRVMDAVNAAGGFTKKADEESLNLAEILKDESRIKVLSKDAKEKGEGEEAVSDGNSDSRLDLNAATLEELMTLPGIGEKRAEAILKLREQKGNFATIEDLLEVEGIKEGIYNKIKDLIKV